MGAVGVFKLKFPIAPFTLGQQHSAMSCKSGCETVQVSEGFRCSLMRDCDTYLELLPLRILLAHLKLTTLRKCQNRMKVELEQKGHQCDRSATEVRQKCDRSPTEVRHQCNILLGRQLQQGSPECRTMSPHCRTNVALLSHFCRTSIALVAFLL